MPPPVLCKICGKRRARRACPAVSGDICTICCGTEREVSLSCPFECGWLQEAHRHEKPVPVSEDRLAHSDITVTEDFLRTHQELLLFCMYALFQGASRTLGAVDADVLGALAALIQTHRTLESGLVYETRAENNLAAAVQRSFTESLANYQKNRAERDALTTYRNAEILAVLVFLHGLGIQNQNGRPRGRMYLDLLRHMLPETGVEEPAPGIIL